MRTSVLATRAVCAVYVQQFIKPLVVIAAGLIAAYIVLITFLAVQFSAWWAIFFLPALPAIIMLAVASFIAFSAIKIIAPAMTQAQQRLARDYVDTFIEVTGHVHTPRFFIIIKIILDIVRRRWKDGFINRTTAQSARLKTDFQTLAKSFQ